MSEATEISACTPEDYAQIFDDLAEFWDGRDVRHLHHLFLIDEFAKSAFVIRDGSRVAVYLFGFLLQTEPVGYVHAVLRKPDADGVSVVADNAGRGAHRVVFWKLIGR